MPKNINTPTGNQESQLEDFLTNKSERMNTFRNFFYNYSDTQA